LKLFDHAYFRDALMQAHGQSEPHGLLHFLNLVDRRGGLCLGSGRHQNPLLHQSVAYTGPIPQPEETAEQKGQYGNRADNPPQAVEMESTDAGQFGNLGQLPRSLIGKKLGSLQKQGRRSVA